MQGDGKVEGVPGMDQLYVCSNSDYGNKIGVAGSRFLRGVTGTVLYDKEYDEE